ncbi:MAG: type IV pilus assembly protein PilM [Planctomycetales bacterium]|nr:type IV pilus assembly protein PilM [Planctomycetales bacterium]
MAKTIGVWGIDIGRCALKALRCRLDGDSVVADGFDYIEYPKLLSQPEADPVQLVKEALEQFLSRNSVKGDKVAISVSGESGLARYFKPPPVDAKKIADIVKYEAKQQIPFALEDVIWDYQRMAGGQEVDGFVLDSEIGLFAMKREAVQKALQPYDVAGIEVDIIQLSPICVYNYISHDYLKPLPEGEEYNSEAPPPSTVVLSIGTDTTDLVITNGYRVWQRNIPLGGNHFTKQLSKDMKLTFAKAEHLKRNPKTADDPKTIFQAMRPVFGDMVTEVQRSVGFFQSLDRKAKIGNVVMLGNTVKLPGLSQYLSKHLGYDIKEIDSFGKLSGANVVTSPSFKDNLLAFATCYGLCLQALDKSKLSTNLLPREIATKRMIRAKKPWAVAALGAAVLAFGLNYVFNYRNLELVYPTHTEKNVSWEAAKAEVTTVGSMSGKYKSEDTEKAAKLAKLRDFSTEVMGTGDRKLLWMELLVALNQALPSTPGIQPGKIPNYKELPFDKRQELHLDYVETQYFPEGNNRKGLAEWWAGVGAMYVDQNRVAAESEAAVKAGGAAPGTNGAAPPSTPPSSGDAAPQPGAAGGGSPGAVPPGGPTGAGWVVELKGHHYFHDPKDPRAGAKWHVRNTLMKNLRTKPIRLPGETLTPGESANEEVFTPEELGIGYVILIKDPILRDVQIPNPNAVPAEKAGVGGFAAGTDKGGKEKAKKEEKEDPDNPAFFPAKQYDFIVQFVWQEKPLRIRLEERKKKMLEAAKAAAAAPPAGTSPAPSPPANAAPPAAAPPAAAPPAGGVAPVAPVPPLGGVPKGLPAAEGPVAPPAGAPPAGAPPAGAPGPELPPAAKG